MFTEAIADTLIGLALACTGLVCVVGGIVMLRWAVKR